MAIALVKADDDTGAAGSFAGGPTMPSEADRFIVVGDTASRVNNWTFAGDVLSDAAVAGVSAMAACAVHPTLAQIAIATDLFTTSIYNYNRTTGVVGSLIAASPSSGFIQHLDIVWSNDGLYLFELSSQSPYIKSISWSGSAFGAWVQPATIPASAPVTVGRGAMEMSPDGNYLAVTTGSGNNGMIVYAHAAGVLTNPISPAVDAESGYGVAWHPAGTFIVLSISSSPYVGVYSWNGSALGAVIVPGVVHGTDIGQRAMFDRNGDYVIVCGASTSNLKNLYSYAWNGSTLTGGATATNPPAALARGMVLTPNNTRLAVVDTNNDVYLYTTGLTLVVPSGASQVSARSLTHPMHAQHGRGS